MFQGGRNRRGSGDLPSRSGENSPAVVFVRISSCRSSNDRLAWSQQPSCHVQNDHAFSPKAENQHDFAKACDSDVGHINVRRHAQLKVDRSLPVSSVSGFFRFSICCYCWIRTWWFWTPLKCNRKLTLINEITFLIIWYTMGCFREENAGKYYVGVYQSWFSSFY